MKAAAFLLVAFATLLPVAASAADGGAYKARAMAAMGYDDNPRLDSDRKGDAYFQESVSLDWKRRFGKKLRLRSGYDVFNLHYSEVTDQNLLYQAVNPGLDWLLAPATALQLDYRFEYLYFPRTETSSHRVHALRAGVLQKVSNGVRLRAGVTPSWRQFTDNKIREAGGALSEDDDRSDDRWAADAEAIVDVWKGATLRAGFVYTRTDSDDFFNDFYDYDSYATRVSLGTRLAKRLFFRAAAGFERLAYDTRPTVVDPAKAERSNVYSASLNLLYELRRDVSLGLGYAYRQKTSNEPAQTYSGSATTLGLYYSF